MELNELEKARENLLKAQVTFRELPDYSFLCGTISGLGMIYYQEGDYPEALKHFIKAKELVDNAEVSRLTKAGLLTNIARVMNVMDRKDEAIPYARASLELNRKSNHLIGMCRACNILGAIYGDLGISDSARYYFGRAIRLADPNSLCFTTVIRRSVDGLSRVFIQQQKYDRAISLLRSIQPALPPYGLENLFNTLAFNYLELEEPDSAVHYAKKALTAGQKHNTKQTIRNAYNYLQLSFRQLRMFDSAYYYFQKFHQYDDSLYYESNQRKFNNLRLDLATLENEREIKFMQQEQTISRLQSQTAIAGLTFGLVSVSLFFFYRHKQQESKRQTLEKSLELNNQKLTSHTLSMLHKNNGFMQIEEEIDVMVRKGEFQPKKIRQIIAMNKSGDNDWENFNNYFGHVHNGFGNRLLRKAPQLNVTEQRLSFLIKMKLTNSEIASVLFIEPRSVSMAKYRLKKKLELPDGQDLHQFLDSI